MSLPRFSIRRFAAASLGSLLLLPAFPAAAAPALLNHQGRMAVNGVNFDGTGQFKFALVNTTGTTTWWSNDGSSTAGSQPAAAVSLTVVKGLYAVLLGDTTLTNMTAVPAAVFDSADVRLRVWFNDGTNGFQQITPDHRLAAAPWALNASRSDLATTVPDDAITTGKIADGTIVNADIAASAAIDDTKLATISTSGKVANGATTATIATTPNTIVLRDGSGNINGTFTGDGSRLTGLTLNSVTAPPAEPVVTWGSNADGQNTIPPLSGVAAVSAGSTHRLVLLDDGTVVSWEAGPAVPAGLAGVTAIAAGCGYNLALRSNGTVTAWGVNTFGQTSIPAGLTTVAGIAAGERHSVAFRTNGTIAAWGDNTFGQTNIPAAATGVTASACGYDHTVALKSSGTVVAWGRNDAGQCDVPAGLAGVVAIGAGSYHSLAVKSDGTVVTWGWNQGGQCDVPGGLTNVSRVAGGYSFSLALKTDGTIVGWGNDAYGQLAVPFGTNSVTAISASNSHAIALRADEVPIQFARLDEENVFMRSVGIGRVPANNMLEVEGDASKSTAGSWLSNSDRRIKTEIRPVTGALEKLDQVRLVDFRYTDDYRAAHPGIQDKRYLNVIAQEFAQVFPEDVKSSGEKMPDGSPILQVDTYPLTIYSAAAVQELHRENQALKATLDEQKRAFDEQKRALASQEERLRKLEAALKQK
jgi:hypothetical protein